MPSGSFSQRYTSQPKTWSQEDILLVNDLAITLSLVLERRRRLDSEARLIKANESKEQFLAKVSHEIRTPMNGIFGLIETLSDTTLSMRQRSILSTVKESSSVLLSIVNDLLDMSRIDNDELLITKLPFDPAECADQVIRLLTPQARKKSLELRSFIASEARTQFVGDAIRLRQVMTNIISNSIKYTDAGTIAVRLSLLKKHGTSSLLRVSVRDTGMALFGHDVERCSSR